MALKSAYRFGKGDQMSSNIVSWRSGYHRFVGQVELATTWQRFWSRQLDFFTWLLVSSLAVGLLWPVDSVNWRNVSDVSVLLNLILFLFMTTILDALCLAIFGQTFGRALAGIRVVKKSGDRLSFTEAFYRNVQVLVTGMGCALPLVYFLALYFAFSNLRKGVETGWDARMGTRVIAEHASLGRTLMTATLYILLLVAIPDVANPI